MLNKIKFLSISLVVGIVLSVVSCNKNSNNKEQNFSETQKTKIETKLSYNCKKMPPTPNYSSGERNACYDSALLAYTATHLNLQSESKSDEIVNLMIKKGFIDDCNAKDAKASAIFFSLDHKNDSEEDFVNLYKTATSSCAPSR